MISGKSDHFLAFGSPDFTDLEIEAVAKVMRSGWVGMGQETILFEEELSAYIGAPHVVTVNSCTSALFLSLLVEGVSGGDEVIVPSLTWCATANAACYLGATPVFCDVDMQTMSVTAQSILSQVTEKTKAVIVVHYGGYAIDVSEIRKVLPNNIAIIEDAAHALGAKYKNGKMVGSSGNLTCYSFYANKNLSTADGGAIALFDQEKADRLRMLRMSGLSSNAWARYIHSTYNFSSRLLELGYKMNYTDLQAAIGRVQLKRLDEMHAHRALITSHYKKRLDGTGLNLSFQTNVFDAKHAKHLMVGVFDRRITGISRDELLVKMKERNIGVCIHYAPLHTEKVYVKQEVLSLPVTDYLAKNIMTLPISAKITTEEVDYIVDNLTIIVGANH